jgi:hypothetical protein
MRAPLVLGFIASLCACGEAVPSGADSAVAVLPANSFELNCRAAKGQVPGFAKRDFRILVNPSAKTYAFSRWSSVLPIKSIDGGRITFRDEVIERGRDNGPEKWHISYDLGSKALDYRESFNGFVPENYVFTTHCEIA